MLTAQPQNLWQQTQHQQTQKRDNSQQMIASQPKSREGPISQLQEYIQSDRSFKVSSKRPVLKWDFDTRMANAVTLEFRATVSFLIEGVPHHTSGSWQSSKKAAQRDAAERTMGLLVGHWGSYSAHTDSKSVAASLQCASEPLPSERLWAFCAAQMGNCSGEPLQWRTHRSGDGWQAIVDLNLFGGVVHTLQGDVCNNVSAAREDTARRALWYLRCPGFEGAFEASEEAVGAETLALPPDNDWRRDGVEQDVTNERKQRIAEQKTLIMRVQNRLQRLYSKQLPQNTSVWEWSFEYSACTDVAVPLCRARVRVAAIDKEFLGDWCRGQKAAQLDTCGHVAEFLDTEELRQEQGSKL